MTLLRPGSAIILKWVRAWGSSCLCSGKSGSPGRGELAGAAVKLAMSAVVPCEVRGTGGAGVEVAVGVKCEMVCLLEVSN